MRFPFIRFCCIAGIGLLAASCSEKPKPVKKRMMSRQEVKELSAQMNVWDAKRENDDIEAYIKRHGLTMTETASGLRWQLLKAGKGEKAKMGNTVRVVYRISLLDGTECYSSEKDGAKEVLIGKDNVESGLHEGLQLMRAGDKMRFILPSHLAHGLTGDQSKIPAFSPVVYEIEMLGIR
jgi:FKBP-type peptidyl-prolyl cis-trans isomerase